jgi:hypothetical protein
MEVFFAAMIKKRGTKQKKLFIGRVPVVPHKAVAEVSE